MIVYTSGTFDLLHYGHTNLLAYCKMIAGKEGRVVVALNKDDFVEEYKGSPPVLNFKERSNVLMACGYVDLVVPNSGGADSKKTINELIEKNIYPRLVVIGSDWHEKDYFKQMKFSWKWLREKGIGVAYVPYTTSISSTDIKKRICDKQSS